MAKTESKRVQLTKHLREMLGHPIDTSHMSSSEIEQLAEGFRTMTNGEAIAAKVIELAVQGKEWAVQFVAERTEGKAVQAERVDGGDRTTEERLTDVTTQHLNALLGSVEPAAQQLGLAGAQPVAAAAAERPAGPASKLLDLPQDRHHRP